MNTQITSGTMMMREGTSLPKSLAVQSVPYGHDWREMKAVDCYSLDREVRSSGWSLFCFAGELRTFVLGRGGEPSVRRGIGRLAGRVSDLHFNCLQVNLLQKRFCGIPYTSFSAHPYHIQDGSYLHVTPEAIPSFTTRVIRSLW